MMTIKTILAKISEVMRRRARLASCDGPLKTTAMGVAVLLVILEVSTALAAPTECAAPTGNAPMLVTEACFDPLFNQPVVEVDEWRDTPVPHRYVNGRFEGTAARFSFYFPPKDRYEGRFFHYTLPAPGAAPGTENTTERNIEFGYDTGAYYVQTNGGGGFDPTQLDLSDPGAIDPAAMDGTIAGYRVDAAAAKFAKELAVEMYGEQRIYGYRYGGSGGSYKTISGAEHTTGVWDGYLPFVMGTPMTIPNTYSVRAHALRVIRGAGKCSTLIDNIEPGGSRDIYTGLDEEEKAALSEATRFGFPPRGWYTCEVMNVGALPLLVPGILAIDKNYFNIFWNRQGYEGTDPNSSVREDRVQFETEVKAIVPAPYRAELFPKAIQLTIAPPDGDLTTYDLTFLTGANAGKTMTMEGMVGDTAIFEPYTANPSLVAAIAPGDKVKIDNSNALALQTYHRHQVPTNLRYIYDRSPGFYVWDQFRGPAGRPIYPQRAMLVGPMMTGTGTVQNGKITGKMMVMQTMMDIDATPWMADWYRTKVKNYLGRKFNDQYRLYYIDNADHGSEVGQALEGQIVDPGRLPTHIVRYRPVLEQLLLDLSAWVETGKKPLESTSYMVEDGQVKLPETAALRKGVQPVIQLSANGQERAEVGVNEPVTFSATISAPPNAGKVVAAQWDFEGNGDFPDAEEIGSPTQTVSLNAVHLFSKPGTYFPVLRAVSQRDGDPDNPWGRIENLDRVRVVVE